MVQAWSCGDHPEDSVQCHLDMNKRSWVFGPPAPAIPSGKGSLGFKPVDTRDVLSPGGWLCSRMQGSIPAPEVACL